MRLSFAFALLGAVVLAPAAPAQTSARLVSTVGDPIPYRIDLPGNWKVSREQAPGPLRKAGARNAHVLTAARGGTMVMVIAMDLLAEQENPLPVSDAEARRMLTGMLLGSDSLLYGMMDQWNVTPSGEPRLRDAVREIRTLGGQRAAYMRGRINERGAAGELEVHFTVRDGIAYFLMFAAENSLGRNETLFGRIRDSLVLAPMPQ
jgi:hypothetical protein